MFARTPRLLLRPPFAEDAPALFRAVADEGIVRQLASAPWPYLPEHAEAFVGTERTADQPACLVFRRTMGAPRLIGAAGLGRRPTGETELGYWIARPYWGLGYATEAAEALVGYARETLRLPRLGAAHFIDNPASGRVLRKLGFVPTDEIAARFSAGRGGAAACRVYALDLANVAQRPALEKVAA
ncbi:MAG: GNAT family N-acetyltransferase [Allosphingosinicella sp.]|uniref:GNAT family N-acetyltransferase n=1 Tax=Allosphingosinicella sp. TaxID=2823234 RepID=UPI0039465698